MFYLGRFLNCMLLSWFCQDKSANFVFFVTFYGHITVPAVSLNIILNIQGNNQI